MKNKYIICGVVLAVILLVGITSIVKLTKKTEVINSLEGTVLSYNNEQLTIQDSNNSIYTFKVSDKDFSVGDSIILEYMGILDKLKTNQDNRVISYQVVNNEVNKEGIFSLYYKQAEDTLNKLSMEDKIKQILLIRYPEVDVPGIGGYVFYEKDFKDKTVEEVKAMINTLQASATIPLLTAVDEEGGKVVRISSNKNLVSEPFKSSKELYDTGGLTLIEEDVRNKSNILHKLGLNVNLAPVVDIADDKSAYMYPRTIGYGVDITSNYAVSVINTSKSTDVSYVLKHFPGYGNNDDTHVNSQTDIRSYDDLINNDIIPFKKGIEAGAEAILVSHNIVTSIDTNNPATLSLSVHNLLKNTLGFTGVTITDDLDMGATNNIDKKYQKALLAGNDLLIVTDYKTAIEEIKNGINNNEINEAVVNQAALKVIAWKYYKNLITVNQK